MVIDSEGYYMLGHERIKEQRKTRGVSPKEVAAATGISTSHYMDMEDSDDEIYLATSIDELLRVCHFLQIKLHNLFDFNNKIEHISFDSLARIISSASHVKPTALSEIENEAGWELGNFIAEPPVARQWCLQQLKDICSAAKVDPDAVLLWLDCAKPD